MPMAIFRLTDSHRLCSTPPDYEKDFEAPGNVSIWLCRFDSEKEMRAYMQEHQTEDDETWSEFYLEFRMGYLDHDFVDYIIHHEQPTSPEELFAQVSYSVSIVENMKARGITFDTAKYNSVICVFDFAFVPDSDYVRKNDRIDYWGFIDYDNTSDKIDL